MTLLQLCHILSPLVLTLYYCGELDDKQYFHLHPHDPVSDSRLQRSETGGLHIFPGPPGHPLYLADHGQAMDIHVSVQARSN